MKGRLNVRRIEKLKDRGRYSDGFGLYLQVMSPTNRSWVFRYERDGRERVVGLGPLHTVPLETRRLHDGTIIKGARDRAWEMRQKLLDGIDPLAARRSEQQRASIAAISFEEVAQAYYDRHEDGWRNQKHRAQFLTTLKTYAYPLIGPLLVSEVNTGHVLKVIEPIWTTKRETASRVRSRIEAVLDFATVRGYRSGDNPARWDGHLSEALPRERAIKHHPALSYTDMPDFMAKLRTRLGTSARALEFLILTAARTGAVIGARRDEIDLKTKP